jgi:hypothetical protein
MKKRFIEFGIIGILLFIGAVCFASSVIDRKVMNDVAVAVNVSNYSDSIRMKRASWYDQTAGLLVTTNGTVVVSQQCSLDGSTWYAPRLSNGTVTDSIATPDSTRYVQFTPVIAPFIRFKVLGNSTSSNVSLNFISSEE